MPLTATAIRAASPQNKTVRVFDDREDEPALTPGAKRCE